MLKLLGPGLGTGFGPAGGSSLKLSDYPPPWEIETAIIAPDDSIPWNYWMNFIIFDKERKNRGMWTPGIAIDPSPDRSLSHQSDCCGALRPDRSRVGSRSHDALSRTD
jgi:hypothetical protein